MEGTLFNYKIFLKNYISHIIAVKYIMNGIAGSFELSHCQTGEIPSTTVYQIGFHWGQFSPASENLGKSTAGVILRETQ
ncbi:hypothetical protein AMTRI_Chr09g32300 [Amborella trichopoda]